MKCIFNSSRIYCFHLLFFFFFCNPLPSALCKVTPSAQLYAVHLEPKSITPFSHARKQDETSTLSTHFSTTSATSKRTEHHRRRNGKNKQHCDYSTIMCTLPTQLFFPLRRLLRSNVILFCHVNINNANM